MFNKFFNSNETISDNVQEEHLRIVAKGRATAKVLGQKNLPAQGDSSLLPYIEGLRGMYQNLYAKHFVPVPAEGSKELANAEQALHSEMTVRLEQKIKSIADAIRRTTLERDAIPAHSKEERQWGIQALIIIIALTEAMFCRKALTIFDRNNNFSQLIILAGLTGFFVYLPHALVRLFRATKNSQYRMIIWAAVGFLLVSGFAILGILRTTYLQQIGTTTMDDVHAASSVPLKPVYLVGINCMFLFVTTLLAAQLKQDDEKAITAKAKSLDEKIAGLEQKLNAAEQELHYLPSRLYQGQVKRSEGAADGKRLTERVSALFRECVSEWIAENTVYRSDGLRPACFDTLSDLEIQFSNNKK